MEDDFSCCICLKVEPLKDVRTVKCDEETCNTLVHKECYDSQKLSSGLWLCGKCISQGKDSQMKCELCPSTEGLLRRTSKGGWCHVVCALFASGAEFLSPRNLDVVSLDNVNTDEFNNVCSICTINNRSDLATTGVCIQCRKTGCDVKFHVTCALVKGLLQEVGLPREGIQYLAHCHLHIQKSKRRRFSMTSLNKRICDKSEIQQTQDCAIECEPPVSNKNSVSEVTSQDTFNVSEIGTNPESYKDSKILKVLTGDESGQVADGIEIVSLSIENLETPSIASHNLKQLTIDLNTNNNILHVNEGELSAVSNDNSKSELSKVRASKRQKTMTFKRKERTINAISESNRKARPNKSATKLGRATKARKLSTFLKTKIEDGIGEEIVVPTRPKSVLDLSASWTSNPNQIDTANCQSMEDLLEWQWNETGALLLKNAEPDDIASLLSCLHDIKNENQQLLTKQIKLLRRRDNIQAVNARLQIQLLTKPLESFNSAFGNSVCANEALSKVMHKPLTDAHHIDNAISCPRLMMDNNSVSMMQSNPMLTQTLSQSNLDQSFNPSSMAMVHPCPQPGMYNPMSQPMSMSNLMPTTDLATYFNNQVHPTMPFFDQAPSMYKMYSSKSKHADIHMSQNNGSSLLHNALQQSNQPTKYAPQILHASQLFNQTASRLTMQSGNGMQYK